MGRFRLQALRFTVQFRVLRLGFVYVTWRVYSRWGQGHSSVHAYDMGVLRWVGSLKLYVFFAEYSLFHRALLQKRPIILRSLLIEATRYSEDSSQHRLFYRALLQKRPVIFRSHHLSCIYVHPIWVRHVTLRRLFPTSSLLQVSFAKETYEFEEPTNRSHPIWYTRVLVQQTATHCNTLLHTATHCNTLQHTATHCNTLQHTATHYYTPICFYHRATKGIA